MSFLDMGGYAAYVWPAYIASAVALIAIGLASWRALRRTERLVRLSESTDKRT
jgi:heme exporter protein D